MRVEQETEYPNVQQIAYLAYIAGVHVPVANVNISYSVMSFPVLSVTVPADPILMKLGEEDRVPVVVFFLDKWYSETNPRVKITPTWRLLYEGDITQWSFSKSASSRSITFNAIAPMSVLNYMTLMYMSGKGHEVLSTLSPSKTSVTMEAVESEVHSLAFYTKGAYGTGVIERPIDFVKNLMLGMKIGGPPHEKGTANERLETLKAIDSKLKNVSSSSVGGEDFKSLRKDGNQKVSAAMEFFIKYNHRNRIDKRWIASDIEELAISTSGTQNSDQDKEYEVPIKTPKGTITKKVSNSFFVAVVKKLTFQAISHYFSNTTAPEGSFWLLIQRFYQQFWFNILLLPTPPFAVVDETQDVPQAYGNVSSVDMSKARLGNCISVPNMTYALPPACNVITPAMVGSVTYAEDYAVQNTRTIVNGRPAYSVSNTPNPTSQAYESHDLKFGYPTDQNDVLEKSNVLTHAPENILIYPEELFKGPVVTRPQAPPYFLMLEQESRYMHKEITKERKDATIRTLHEQSVKSDDGKKDGVKVSGQSWRQEMLYSFAKSYYLENKYSARNGTINLNFNPYLIPGLPFVMIDNNDADQFHLTGFINTVGISLSPTGASTSITYSSGRTLKETYEQVFTENTFGPEGGLVDVDESTTGYQMYSTAPVMPIRVLADKLQVDEKAAEYYKNLLYANDRVNNTTMRPMVYRHAMYFNSTSGDSILKDSSSNVPSSLQRKIAGKTFPGSITRVKADETGKQIGSMEVDLKVKSSQYASINSYEISMQRAARPICTLQEYMKMFNTAEDYTKLVSTKFVSDDEYGVAYPVQIRLYHVKAEELGDSFIRPYAKSSYSEVTAELRKDWPSRLLVYRERIKAHSILGK